MVKFGINIIYLINSNIIHNTFKNTKALYFYHLNGTSNHQAKKRHIIASCIVYIGHTIGSKTLLVKLEGIKQILFYVSE